MGHGFLLVGLLVGVGGVGLGRFERLGGGAGLVRDLDRVHERVLGVEPDVEIHIRRRLVELASDDLDTRRIECHSAYTHVHVHVHDHLL